ncbi:hypothetical protein ACFX14_002727 [Malus domestica]
MIVDFEGFRSDLIVVGSSRKIPRSLVGSSINLVKGEEMGWSLRDRDDIRLRTPGCPINCFGVALAFLSHWGPVSRGPVLGSRWETWKKMTHYHQASFL